MKFNLDHHQSIAFPFAFEIVEDARQTILQGAQRWPFVKNLTSGVLFLSGSSGSTTQHTLRYEEAFKQAFECECHHYRVKNASFNEARLIDEICAKTRVSLLVAVGGGTVIDVAKMVVKLRGTPLIVIPSVLSSDCLASPISVLANDSGVRESLSSGIPSALLVDLGLTATAPKQLTLSGVGDVVSNVSALLDLHDYELVRGESVSGFSKMLSRAAYEMVLGLDADKLSLHSDQRKLAIGLVLSGMAMSFAGNSLPCSGAEHLISHAIDGKALGSGTHGIQVGLATLYCIELRKLMHLPSDETQPRLLFERISFPLSPKEIGLSKQEFLDCVKLGVKMRPGRYTLLNRLPDERALGLAYDSAFG